jgi:4-carboxymuconolactone decarboxylase
VDEALSDAYALRRAMLGDAYVDAQQTETDPVAREFPDHSTRQAWGVWTRGGALSNRDRSLLVLAMTAALGRLEEFKLHASAQPRTGVTDAEVDELLFQLAAYCGAPAAISAKRALREVRATRAADATQAAEAAQAADATQAADAARATGSAPKEA